MTAIIISATTIITAHMFTKDRCNNSNNNYNYIKKIKNHLANRVKQEITMSIIITLFITTISASVFVFMNLILRKQQ